MTPELWGIVAAAVVGLVTAITLALKKNLPKYLDVITQKRVDEYKAEIEAEAYERNRLAFREDKYIEILEVILKDMQEERDKDREEARQERELQRAMITTVDKLAQSIGRLRDMSQILAQNAAKVDNRLANLEMVIRQASENWTGNSHDGND